MPEGRPAVFSVLFPVLAAEFSDAWDYASNTIATVISTEVISPVSALSMARVLNVRSSPFGGATVTRTTGREIVKGPATEATACL